MSSDLTVMSSVSRGPDERTRIVTATVRAVLFREILKPLAAQSGPVGETAVDAVADSLFAAKPR